MAANNIALMPLQRESGADSYLSALAQRQQMDTQAQANQRAQAQESRQQTEFDINSKLRAIDTLGGIVDQIPDGDAQKFGEAVNWAVQNGLLDPNEAAKYNVSQLPQIRAMSQRARDLIKERNGTGGGPFAGTGFEASSANIIVRGQRDPSIRSSPEYALAFSNLTQPRVIQDAAGRSVLYTPPLPQGILPPIGTGSPPQAPQQQGNVPAPNAQAQSGGRVPGAATPIPGLEAPSPIPSEVAARIGLARGFLERYDNIAKQLPDLGTLKGRAQLIFNTGKGAAIKRYIESGMEALIRQLTGAGKSKEEAESYASRYAPSAFDTAFDTKSKLEALKYDLTHSADEVMSGRGGFHVTPQADEPPVVRTKAEFDALPSGAIYIEDDGQKYRKP